MPRTAPAVCSAVHKTDPDRPRRAADGLNLCRGCLKGMHRNLSDLPWLHAEVVTSMPTTRATGSAPVSGSRTPGLPVNLRAGELHSQMGHDLRTIAGWVAKDRGIHLPVDGRVGSVCAWLAKHVNWLAASQYAADVRGVLTELVGRAWAVIDPDRRPMEVGPCVELVDSTPCDGMLWASVLDVGDPRPSKIWCDGCELELTPEQWYRFGRRYEARRRMSA
ncbi:hypothetical protein [Acrocarpospora catenulata]|uniref:hypothetical protein n=1 Tax=Acrocarpospora catenulata TaxID=2836182 RepID=UPI001BDB09F8|nr:hypothetical protein [Acrocarpospora catenulata]